MSKYRVTAVRWERGWELHIDGEGVTQSHTLDDAEAMVRDYLETMYDRSFEDAEIEIVPAS